MHAQNDNILPRLAIRLAALLVSALAIVSCSDDVTAPAALDTQLVTATFSVEDWADGRTRTSRAAVTDCPAPAVDVPQQIGVWAWRSDFGNGVGVQVFDNQAFGYDHDHSDVYKHYAQVKADGSLATDEADDGSAATGLTAGATVHKWLPDDYRFYAYAPYNTANSAAGAPLRSLTPTTTGASTITYPDISAQHALFTALELPAASDEDMLVGTNAVLWNPTVTSPLASNGNYCVPVTLAHVYACLQFAFLLDEAYARDLRYIEVQSVTISNYQGAAGGSVTYRLDNGFWGTGSGTTTTESVSSQSSKYGATYAGRYLLGLPLDAAGVTTVPTFAGYSGAAPASYTATASYEPFGAVYVYPQSLALGGTFDVTVVYDVYDHAGQLCRDDVSITNTVSFSDADVTTIYDQSSNQKGFTRGHYYNILIKIVPDFLYVLSDNDQSADIVIKTP